MARLDVQKTYKLFIGGAFPRSESGRCMPVETVGGTVNVCLASRKDLRDAVEAARGVQAKWAAASAYNRGKVMYRMAEMMEGKRAELAAALDAVTLPKAKPAKGKPPSGKSAPKAKPILSSIAQVEASIDRLVSFAGWADKYGQVLGCNNPVTGPYYNFTVPEPTGVVAVVAGDALPLLGLIALLAPVICSGNTCVALASEVNPIAAAVLGEVFATSDLPGGVVNILTGQRNELLSHIAGHRDIDGVYARVEGPQAQVLRAGVAENLKRVVVSEPESDVDQDAGTHPWLIEPFVEMKTVWHPASV